MAVNCLPVPFAMLGLVGVRAMATNVAGVTVSVVDPEVPPNVAVIVVEPVAIDAARPWEPTVLLIVATPVLDEFQMAEVVRSCVVLSENVPVAVNCLPVPLAILGLVGVIAMEVNVAGVTVSVVEPETLPEVAVIVVAPVVADVASPCEPAVLLIAAAPVFEELQRTEVVRSCVVLSEKVPVATNCCVVPLAMPGLVGVRARDTSVACEIVISVSPETPSLDALILALPIPLPITCPGLSIVALVSSDETQATVPVTSLVLLFACVAVAVNCSLVLYANDGFGGVREIETIGEESVPLPPSGEVATFPHPARLAMNSNNIQMTHTFFCTIGKPSSALSNKKRVIISGGSADVASVIR